MEKVKLLFLLLILIPLVSAAEEDPVKLVAKADIIYTFKFPCNLNGWYCNPTTACNLTISYSNSSTLIANQLMTVRDGFSNYTLTAAQTSTIGVYPWAAKCSDPLTGLNATTDGPFYITATGDLVSGTQASLYILMFFGALILMLGFGIAGSYLPSNNKSDAMTGYVIAVSNMKYVKIFCWCMSYLMLVIVTYFLWMISHAYLSLGFMTDLLRFMFYFLAWATIPFFIVGLYITIANIIRDSGLKEQLERGLRIKE